MEKFYKIYLSTLLIGGAVIILSGLLMGLASLAFIPFFLFAFFPLFLLFSIIAFFVAVRDIWRGNRSLPVFFVLFISFNSVFSSVFLFVSLYA